MDCRECGHRHLTDEDEGVVFALICLECGCDEGTV